MTDYNLIRWGELTATPTTRGCPNCRTGKLVPHCPPGNRCAWWICDDNCGFAIDISMGWQTLNLRRGQQSIDSADRGDES